MRSSYRPSRENTSSDDPRQAMMVSRDSDLRVTQHPKLFESETSKLVNILKKPVEQRSGQDNQYLNLLIKQNPGLSALSQEVSVDFVKNLMKEAEVVHPGKNKIIYSKGDQIRNMGIVFTGNLANIKKMSPDSDHQPPIETSNDYVFHKLIQMAKTYTRQLRKKQSIMNQNMFRVRRSNSIIQKDFDYLFGDYQKSTDDVIQSYINQNEIFGFQDRSCGDVYANTCVCLNQETTLLIFKENNVMTNLQAAFKEKLKKITNLLKAIPCFSILDVDKLSSIIQSMATRKKKKFDIVYREGDPTNHIYMLSEGEIKITKDTHLFEQNPNNLYGNRKKLVQQAIISNSPEVDKSQQKIIKRKVDSSVLPYADLTLMYNFRPITKNIQIGVVTPFSLFGQQEYCQRRKRDTNAICSSLEVQYYQISIKKLQQIIGAKLIFLFQNELRSSVRKKVLYRQSQYANSIQFENNNNMNYFYFEDGKEKESPRKYRINKINKHIESKPQVPHKQAQQSTIPTFTTFNFHKMTRQIKSVPKTTRSQPQSEDESKLEQNPIQMKIMDITHTWQLMKQKVDMQLKTSRRISPNKAIINITKPLIGSQFFFKMDKQAKRIQRQHRKRIGSVGRNIKLNSISQRSPRIQ